MSPKQKRFLLNDKKRRPTKFTKVQENKSRQLTTVNGSFFILFNWLKFNKNGASTAFPYVSSDDYKESRDDYKESSDDYKENSDDYKESSDDYKESSDDLEFQLSKS